ncbi:amidohydrolase family protein [Vibrio caribbeanicus]|uniref:amidohydrolase family protein n=1 Tax=Vibrio caribbeanicus TaxID=701175 RepID=UPI00228471DC|nr:amidohydrolase family protein [Vibrio caribbeanicus]MCY9845813.1 amidohydrolase family protein [Vibrio caribbeanicus]
MEKDNSRNRMFCLKNVNYFNENKKFKNGDVYISSGHISKIKDAEKSTDEGYIPIDASGKYAQPGYINAHLHPSKELYMGLSLYDPISNVLDAVHKNNISESNESQYHASVSSLHKQILNGVTGVGIFTSRPSVDAEAALNIGIRANIQYAVNDTWVGKESIPVIQEQNDIIENFSRIYQKYTSELISVSPATASEISCSDNLLKLLNKLAKDHDSFFSMHINEGKHQSDQCFEYFNKSGLERLESLGILDSHVNLIHCCHINNEDVNIINRNPTANIIHCPISNSFVGAGTLPTYRIRNNIALGTDAAMVNPSNSINSDALFALYHHGDDGFDKKLSSENLIDMVTINGAKCLGMTKSGYIREGFSADILLYNNNDHLKFDESISDINKFIINMINKKPEHVFVQGKHLVDNFKLA